MPHITQFSVRRALASCLLVIVASAAPTAASADSLSGTNAYLLDPYAGTLTYGDGATGAIPTTGSLTYTYGGGASGNTSTWSFGCFVLWC
jgi:hypothetical protein